MKGYWHIVAISVVISVLMIVYANYLLIAAFFIWLFLLHFFKRLRKIPFLLSLLFFIFFSIYIPHIDKPTSEAEFLQMNRQLIGEIVSPVLISETKIDFIFQEEQLETKIQILLFPKEDVYHQTDYSALKHGANCKINGEIELPEESTNPGQFDYRTYLLTKGITHQVVLRSENDFQCEGASLLNKVFSIRINLINYVVENISNETAAWLNALVLGNDSLLSDEMIELFQRWSLSHILAISGLHVGLIVGIVYFLLIKLNVVTKENAQWVMMIFLPIYALIAGGEPSVWRASTMVLLFIVINKTNIKFSITDILSIVFIVLILFDKYIVYHIGFQLSFIVTFGLILSRRWIKNSRPIYQILQISFVSQMMILPLLFNYFSQFQPLSIIMNVIVVPYFSLFVIPFMFILLLLSPLSSFLITMLDASFVKIHYVFLSFIQFIDSIANYPWIIGEFPLVYTVIYYMLFFIFMMNIEMNHTKNSFKYGLFITLLITSLAVQPYLSSTGTITMLDIGQGDAFVIELPYRKGVIFVDAGSRFSFDTFEPSKRVYNQVIKPYLYSKGINKVNTIILSHEHLDHYGSTSFIAKDMNVEEIVISEYYELHEELELQWKKAGVNIKRFKKDEIVEVSGQKFHVLSPARQISVNENSLVVFTELGGMSWLFTGDIGKETEKAIIRSYPNLSVDVLKVAHHGSDTSTDADFLEQTNPQFGLIPVGINNSYGHPSSEVINTLKEAGTQILRTDLNGAVQYHFKNHEGTFSTYLPYNEHSN